MRNYVTTVAKHTITYLREYLKLNNTKYSKEETKCIKSFLDDAEINIEKALNT